jgi:HSP20 family protein
MNNLITRSGLFDDFFKDLSPGFFIKPLHGDALPAQVKIDVKDDGSCYTLHAEVSPIRRHDRQVPGVAKDIHVSIDGAIVSVRAKVSPCR